MARFIKRRRTTRAKTKVSSARVRRVVFNMAEKKFFNQTMGVAATPLVVGATWQFFSTLCTNSTTGSVVGIKQGTGASDRLGNKILLRQINFTIRMTPTFASGMTDGCFCRVIVYKNKEAVGSVPTGADMFVLDVVDANRNIPLTPKLSVLRDLGHTMVTTAAVAASTPLAVGPVKLIKFSVFPNKIIDYSGGNSGAITDILKHDFGIGFCATEANACNVVCAVQSIFSDV